MIQRILLSPQMSKQGNLMFYLGEILIAAVFYTFISTFTTENSINAHRIHFLSVLGFFWSAMWGVICITYYPKPSHLSNSINTPLIDKNIDTYSDVIVST